MRGRAAPGPSRPTCGRPRATRGASGRSAGDQRVRVVGLVPGERSRRPASPSGRRLRRPAARGAGRRRSGRRPAGATRQVSRSSGERVVAGEVAQVRPRRHQQRVEPGLGRGGHRARQSFGVDEQLGHGANVLPSETSHRPGVRWAPCSRPALSCGPRRCSCVALAACSSSSGGDPPRRPHAYVRSQARRRTTGRSPPPRSPRPPPSRPATRPRSKEPSATQGTLQLSWAKLITANPSCFPSDTVAAAKEYLSGHGG